MNSTEMRRTIRCANLLSLVTVGNVPFVMSQMALRPLSGFGSSHWGHFLFVSIPNLRWNFWCEVCPVQSFTSSSCRWRKPLSPCCSHIPSSLLLFLLQRFHVASVHIIFFLVSVSWEGPILRPWLQKPGESGITDNGERERHREG